jgi:hypothetical protein
MKLLEYVSIIVCKSVELCHEFKSVNLTILILRIKSQAENLNVENVKFVMIADKNV